MAKIDLNNLSATERKDVLAQLKAQEAEEAKAHEDEIEQYKTDVDLAVTLRFPQLEHMSAELSKVKRETREIMQKLIRQKQKLYGVKKDQQLSHTFITKDQTHRITVGTYVNDSYDDTVTEGITLVKNYIKSLGKDKDSEMLVDTILKLLAKDQKGNLKASRVLQLQQMADKSHDDKFQEGVQIIRNAYKPLESKTFIRAEYKDKKTGEWISVPLGMSEV